MASNYLEDQNMIILMLPAKFIQDE